MSNIGIRRRLWEQGKELAPRDIAEGLRDLDDGLRSFKPRRIIETDVTWTLPFTLGAQSRPDGIVIIRVQTPSTPTVGLAALPSPMWTWKDDHAEVFRCDGLTVGTRYVITWELIG